MHRRMSLTIIPLAPTSFSVNNLIQTFPFIIALTANQPSLLNGAMVGDSSHGDAAGALRISAGRRIPPSRFRATTMPSTLGNQRLGFSPPGSSDNQQRSEWSAAHPRFSDRPGGCFLSTTSAMASATPSCTEISTAPSSFTI